MPGGTWNIAEVELIESHTRMRALFARVAGMWGIAFALIVCVSFVQLGGAEAAPAARVGAMPGPGAPAMLAGVVTGSGGIALVLWQRIAAAARK